MTFKRFVSLLLALALITVCFSGCKKKTQFYDTNAKILSVETSVVASNDKLSMTWDNDAKCVLLENKETGKIWSTIPYDQYKAGNYGSTLMLCVQDMQTYQRDTYGSEELIKKNKISCKKIKNGVEVTYYFDDVKIAIPITYTLREDSMLVKTDTSKAIEGDSNYRIYYVAPVIKLCSVLQSQEDAYIMAPWGIGGIVKTASTPDGHIRLDEKGKNIAALSTTNFYDPAESSGMQVFGIKDSGDALFAIAEDCAGAVGINLSAGDRTSDYSNVYPTFFFVDYDDVKGRSVSDGDVRQISDRANAEISVGFYPLSGDDADYNGMARRYRKYLIDRGYVSKNYDKKDYSSPYAVTLFGGVEVTESVVGVPNTSLKSMTTFSQAKSILSDLVKYTGEKPVVRLQGFGKSGNNIGAVAGGYGFASLFGSDEDYAALQDYCKSNGMPIYTQFEMVKYGKSGSGFSYTYDAAKTATLHAAEQSLVNLPLRDANGNTTTRLLARGELSGAVDKLISLIDKKNISGVSLSGLGEVSYSDYNDSDKYAVTCGMQEDTKEYIERLIKTGKGVAGSASTYFAAGLLDAVFEAPLDTSGKFQYTNDIPFYQMVLAGITPLYSAPINTDSNPERKIMLAAASGTGLSFALINDFDKTYMENNIYEFYACVYSGNKERIKSALSKYTDVYKQVAGSLIESYEIVDRNVTKTTFENGKVIYANHSSRQVESPAGTLEGYGFKLEG